MEAEGTSFFIQECGLVNEVTAREEEHCDSEHQ